MADNLNTGLSQEIGVLGIKVWELIGIIVGLLIVGILCTLTCYLTSRKKVKVKVTRGRDRVPIPAVSKEIKEVRVEQVSTGDFAPRDGILLTIHDKNSDKDSDKVLVHLGMSKLKNGDNASSQGSFHHMDRDIYCESGEDGSSGNFHLYKPSSSSSHPISAPSPLVGLPEFSHLGWGHWFTLRDLELATNRFSKDNVIGEGGYGVVYRGTLVNRNPVAVKKLLNNPGYPHPSRRHLPTVPAHRLLQISAHLLFSMATESTLESPVITSIPITTPSLTIVHFPSSLKLLSNNYLGWKTQVEAILHGLDLFKFIDGSHPPPLPTTDETGRSTPHSDFQAWFRQDRLLFGALVGSLSPPIVPLITNATSSLDAWKILSNTYASPSRGHIKQLQHRLKRSSKNPTQSVTEYMQSVKTLVDELSILCKQMDTEDITDIILNGLDQSSYKPFISAIHARDNPISFHELHEKLINHELSSAQSTPLTPPPPPPPIHHPTTAFLTHSKQHPKPWQPQPSNNSFHCQPGLLPTPNTPSSSPRPFLGKCQFCFKQGHSLTSCHAFKKQHPNIHLTQPSRSSYPKPQAHTMTPNQATEPNSQPTWLFDSGASHHITNDLSTLSLHAPYDGTEELVIGDAPLLQHFTWQLQRPTFGTTDSAIPTLKSSNI
ncbi:hypothetical protein E3N88_35389 [Mikania micrantha]|uniref:Protein kinase domain-containing protein n=1 Tax=Mikania micrantha TaxID=192012 RepID=A0A5N6M0T0_9ASTR|nr:hypothetical protein E3N88_35389 [Mikania micrantha]